MTISSFPPGPADQVEQEGERVLATTALAVEKMEGIRHALAALYVTAPGGSEIEHEVGECLTVVRKSLTRMRKAVGKLSQMGLPLE